MTDAPTSNELTITIVLRPTDADGATLWEIATHIKGQMPAGATRPEDVAELTDRIATALSTTALNIIQPGHHRVKLHSHAVDNAKPN